MSDSNVGLGTVELTAEEKEIERLERKVKALQSGLRAMEKWLDRKVREDVNAPGMPPKEMHFSPDYLNDLSTMRRALGKSGE